MAQTEKDIEHFDKADIARCFLYTHGYLTRAERDKVQDRILKEKSRLQKLEE